VKLLTLKQKRMKHKNSFRLILVLLLTLSIFSCEKEKIDSQNTKILDNQSNSLELEFKKNDLTFKFKSNSKNQIINSNLQVFSNGKLLIESINFIDTKIPAYKLIVHKNLIKKAEELKKNSNIINQIIDIKNDFEIFAREVLSNNNLNSYTPLVQSLFYHNSILNIIERSFKNNNDCECTPHPGYFVDYTPFWCQEDYFIDVAKFTKLINNSNSKYLINKKDVIKFLNDYENEQVSIDKISKFIETKESFLSRIETNFNNSNNSSQLRCSNGLGSDLGCCGNYSGCCWYWSYYCLDHDLACLGCDKWHCGPACQPSN